MNLEEVYNTIQNEFKAVNKLIDHFEAIISNDKEEVIEKFPELEELDHEGKEHPPIKITLKRTMDVDEVIDFYEFTHQSFQVSFTYPKILWGSLFLSIFSFFEHVLNMICREVVQSMPDYGQNAPLKRYQKVLKSQGIDFPDQHFTWRKIIFYKELRNVIVHNRSHIETFNFRYNDTRSKINDHTFLSISNGYLILDPIFLKEVMDTFQAFISILFKRIHNNESSK